jgi:hypothetical protein
MQIGKLNAAYEALKRNEDVYLVVFSRIKHAQIHVQHAGRACGLLYRDCSWLEYTYENTKRGGGKKHSNIEELHTLLVDNVQ